MTGRLKGKIALVTGASKGIGKAIAELFALEGAELIATARDGEALAKLSESVGKNGGKLHAIPGDIADDAFVESLFESIKKSHGRLDILVNNAGIVDGGGDVERLTPEKFREVLDVNVVALYSCMRQAIMIMRENGDAGKIVNIGSVRSHWTEQGEAGAYNASKYAVKGLTESVARLLIERKSKIAVGMVCPGIVDTPIHKGWQENGAPERRDWLRPETVAEAALHAALAPDNVNVFDTVIMPTFQNPF